MKYKIGDYVVIKNDLVKGQIYGKYQTNSYGHMDAYYGKVAKIIGIEDHIEILCGYFIINDNKLFHWTDEMIERLATEEEKERFKIEMIAELL